MVAIDQIEQRLTAVEQILADGDHDFKNISELVDGLGRLEDLESRIEDIEARIATIEGRTESVEAYVGNIESINEGVEHQADMAIASVDRLERRIIEIEQLMDISTVKRIDGRLDKLETELRRLSSLGSETDGEDDFEAVAFGETDDTASTETGSTEAQQSETRSSNGDTQDENSAQTASQASEAGGS